MFGPDETDVDSSKAMDEVKQIRRYPPAPHKYIQRGQTPLYVISVFASSGLRDLGQSPAPRFVDGDCHPFATGLPIRTLTGPQGEDPERAAPAVI